MDAEIAKNLRADAIVPENRVRERLIVVVGDRNLGRGEVGIHRQLVALAHLVGESLGTMKPSYPAASGLRAANPIADGISKAPGTCRRW